MEEHDTFTIGKICNFCISLYACGELLGSEPKGKASLMIQSLNKMSPENLLKTAKSLAGKYKMENIEVIN